MSTDARPVSRGGIVLLASVMVAAALVAQPIEEPETPYDPPSSPTEPTDAEEPVEGLETASYVSSSLTLGPAWDSGLRSREQHADDLAYLASPALLMVQRPSPRTELTLAYEPELYYYPDREGFDGVDHVGGALLRHATSRRSEVVVGGSYLDGEDPGRHLGGDLLVMPRAPYRQWRAWTGFSHRWSRNFLLLNLGRTSTRVESELEALASDQTDDSATLTLGRDLTPRTHLSASYSVLDPHFDTPVSAEDTTADPLPRFQEPVHTFTLGLGVKAAPLIGFFVDAGVLQQAGESDVIGGLEVVRTGESLAVRLRYDRAPLSLGPSLSADGAVPTQPLAPSAGLRNAVSDTISLGLRARPARRLRWDQSLWASRTDLPGADALESWAVTSRFVYQVTERVGPFVEVQLLDQDAPELLGGSASRERVFVGLVLGLTGPAGTWGIREEPRVLRTVLPDRRNF